MATTAKRIAIGAFRNELLQVIIRVTGADLTASAAAGSVRSQVRMQPDTPGSALINLGSVTTAAAEGIKLDRVDVVDGVPVSVLIFRINKSTMSDASKVPYAGEIGAPTRLAFGIQWDGRTRLYGDLIVLANALDSENAPTSRPAGFGGWAVTGPTSAIDVTVSNGDVVSVLVDGADIALAAAAAAKAAAEQATAAGPLISSRIRAVGMFAADTDADLAFQVGGNPNELTLLGPDALPVNAQTSIVIMEANTGPTYLTIAGDRKRLTDGGGQDLAPGALQPRYTYRLENSPGGAYALFPDPAPPKEVAAVIPRPRLSENLIGNPFGALSIAGGTVQPATRQLRIVGRGSSIGNALGGTKATDAPSAILTKRLNEQVANARRLRRLTFVEDNRSQDGTGTLDIVAQGESSSGPEVNLVTLTAGMNDIFFFLFVMNHTWPAMRAAIRGALLAEVRRGVIPVVLTTYHPHTEMVNLADQRFADQVAAGRAMSYPIGKASPTAQDVRNAIGSDVTAAYDWTGGGVTLPGVGAAALFNDMLRDEVANCPGFAILADTEWASFRYCLEPAKGNAALKNSYYADAVHGTSKLYQGAFDPVLSAIARGLAKGDLTTRYYRGDEA